MRSTEPAISPRTVLEAHLPATGTADMEPIYAAAHAVGINDHTLRLAVRRMVAQGDLRQHGRGRAAQIAPTASGRARLERDRVAFRLAVAQDHGYASWDGKWRLTAVSAAESNRAQRDTARRALIRAGAAALSTSLYVSPHSLDGVLAISTDVSLVRATATDLEVAGCSTPAELAERLWPAGPIETGYRGVEATLEELSSSPPTSSTSLVAAQLHLAEAMERALRHDPLVPPELRSPEWEPARVRRRWYAVWAELAHSLGEDRLYPGWLTRD
ncbi:PaaX family transcriptional regulator [Ruania rhizosphaerae]|uniref:PaaX family transcriptional regulator n=1 Tax=Ruania rhizosphaerae TaxID=1840413 RepID=UPI0013569542|nr:PaaX family transcriptional regulator [Ruania rhizosphaerae]